MIKGLNYKTALQTDGKKSKSAGNRKTAKLPKTLNISKRPTYV